MAGRETFEGLIAITSASSTFPLIPFATQHTKFIGEAGQSPALVRNRR